MIVVFLRECIVLVIGVAVSFIASLFGDAGNDFGALAAAILFPIAFCLVRAAMIRLPDKQIPPLRRGAFQVTVGLALVFLLMFEMGTAMFAGAPDVPHPWWIVVVGFGVSYLLLYCVAHHITNSWQRHAAG